MSGEWNRVAMTPCGPSDFQALLRFLDRAFRKDDGPWFGKYMSHIFLPHPESVRCHRVARDHQGIAGVVGIYPIQLKVGTTKLNVGGVGSVAVREDLRGRGLMSSMLRNTLTSLRVQGYDISWLGGNRYRYRNYGWDFAGRHTVFSVYERDLMRYMPDVKPATPRKARISDIPAMMGVYGKIPCRALRSRSSWNVHIRRKGLSWKVVRVGGRLAYLACDSTNPRDIFEIAGGPRETVALLLGHARRHKRAWLRVEMSMAGTALSRLLYRVGANFAVHHNYQLCIVDVAATWRKLGPAIAAQGVADSVKGAHRQLGLVKSKRDRELLLGRALGFLEDIAALPRKLRDYEWVRPLNWWMSNVDHV